jgi:hypothetical protein
MSDVYIFGVAWEEIVDWFIAQPLYGQILVLIGVFAVLALVVVVLYFVLKGIAYLIYYVLKGVYYLLKGIGLLFYKLFEGLYYAISGKPKPESADVEEEQVPPKVIVIKEPEPITPVQRTYQTVQSDVSFCSECGSQFSDSMVKTLSDKGFVFCVRCGHGFQANSMKIES